MTNYLKCLILLLFVGNLAIAGEKKVRCVIRGELIGMETKEVLLVDATVDSRYHGTYVPVEDGRFKYMLELPHVEGYKLVFVTKNPRVWYTVPFIVENGKLHITVNVDKSYEIRGGIFNDRYRKYQELQQQEIGWKRFSFMHKFCAGQWDELYYFLVVMNYNGVRCIRRSWMMNWKMLITCWQKNSHPVNIPVWERC